jgi:hypothetical protein
MPRNLGVKNMRSFQRLGAKSNPHAERGLGKKGMDRSINQNHVNPHRTVVHAPQPVDSWAARNGLADGPLGR